MVDVRKRFAERVRALAFELEKLHGDEVHLACFYYLKEPGGGVSHGCETTMADIDMVESTVQRSIMRMRETGPMSAERVETPRKRRR